MTAVYGSSSGFPSQADGAPAVNNEIVTENDPWDLYDLSSTNDRRPSAFQYIQALCPDNGLSIASDTSAM